MSLFIIGNDLLTLYYLKATDMTRVQYIAICSKNRNDNLNVGVLLFTASWLRLISKIRHELGVHSKKPPSLQARSGTGRKSSCLGAVLTGRRLLSNPQVPPEEE